MKPHTPSVSQGSSRKGKICEINREKKAKHTASLKSTEPERVSKISDSKFCGWTQDRYNIVASGQLHIHYEAKKITFSRCLVTSEVSSEKTLSHCAVKAM